MSNERNTATLERIAQRRSVWRRVHEYMNVPRRAREEKESVYGAQMQALRRVDDYARMMASGIKQDLKEAKQLLKDQYHPSYIDLYFYLRKIDNALKHVSGRLDKLTERQDQALKPAQTRTSLSDPELASLEQDAESELEAAAELRTALLKMGRGEAAKALQMVHGNAMAARYEAAHELVYEHADKLVGAVLRQFKLMDKARAKGEPGMFIDALQNIGEEWRDFHPKLMDFYKAHVKPLLQARRGEEEEEPKKEDKEPDKKEDKKDEPEKKKEEPEETGSEKKFEEEDETIIAPVIPSAEKPSGEAQEPAEGFVGVEPAGELGGWEREFEPGELGEMQWTRHKGRFMKPITTPVPAPAPAAPVESPALWHELSAPWESEEKWMGYQAEGYEKMLGMVKQAMAAGDRTTASKWMDVYSDALMKGGFEDEAYEAKIMALELLSDE